MLLSLKLLARRKKTQKRKTYLHRSFILPLILPSTINYANLHSMLQLPPPSIARCKSVLHNTQTNKTLYPCVPCGSDRIIPTVSMQKVDSTENKQTNKKRNPKNSLCSHYQSDFLSGHTLSFNGIEGDCERVFCFVLFLGLVEKI
jgi:hypothetical protein